MIVIDNPVGREIEAAEAMALCRQNIMFYDAFFGAILVHLKPVMTRDVPTMAVDGTHLFYNPDYVLSLSKPEIEGVQVHECLHVALMHFARLLSADPLMWNCSTDFAINRDIKAGGKYRLPGKEVSIDSPKEDRGHLYDPRFAGMSAESILAYLMGRKAQQQQGKPQQGQGQPQQGQGQGQGQDGQQQGKGDGQGKPGKGDQPGQAQDKPGQGQGGQDDGQGGQGAGQPAKGVGEALEGSLVGDVLPLLGKDGQPATKAEIEEQATTWEIRVRQAVAMADKRAGHVPGSIREMINKLNNPEVDWQEKMRDFVGHSLSRDSTWDRPNKRFEDTIVPSRPHNAVTRILFLIDTSMSMSVPELRLGLSEGQGMLNDGDVEEVQWACIDTRVASHGVVRQGESFEAFLVSGRGGTNFAQPMAWAAEQEDVAAIVCFTDGEVYQWGEEPGVPVLWIGCERHRRSLAKAPYGEVTYIK